MPTTLIVVAVVVGGAVLVRYVAVPLVFGAFWSWISSRTYSHHRY